LLGWKSTAEQDALIDGNDVLLLNSLIEGEPLVIREAHKRGILVVARNITGVRGLTLKLGRFESRESLRAALKASSLGMLRRRVDKGSNEISKERLNATKTFLFDNH
jgi:hypothetical protein